MSTDWPNIVLRIAAMWTVILVIWVLIRWAIRDIKETQALKDQLIVEKAKAVTVEKSNESAEAAAARSDPGVHDEPTVVRGDQLPAWTKRFR